MKKIAVLVSGGGTNLQALIDYEKAHADCPYNIAIVISDHKDAFALERAAKAGIKTAITSPYAPLILAAVLSIASSTVAVWTRSIAI